MSCHLDNSSSDFCYKKLFNAVLAENIDEVKRQLQNPNIDVNYYICDGGTVLFTSLLCENTAIFECLVKAGFDIDIRNTIQETPLHTAVIDSHISFVHALIKKGADINAKNQYNYTPLNHAILHGNVDALCMLLYYDVDTNTVCTKNMTPFMWALANLNFEITNILFDFYDDFSCKNNSGETALWLAAKNRNPLCIEIFKKSTNNTNECFQSLLLHSLDYQNVELFKLIWSKHKEDICLEVDLFNSNLLLNFVSCSHFSNSDWLDCLYLLFSSSITFASLHGCERGLAKKPFFTNLIRAFYNRQIDLHHRMALINLCLSCGINVGTNDINLASLLYGFNEEVETFIHTLNYQQTIISKDFLPLPRFIFVLEDNYKIDSISPIFEFWEESDLDLGDIKQHIIVKLLGFTSMSSLQKQAITNVCMDYLEDYERIIEMLDAISEMPSLLELCRNRIRQQYSGVKAYQFHTKINELNLPPYLKDVVRFKTALY